ncbi:hypothetical protein QAD02_009581 [Eretmocerus hayati]|uniref:Uncharacterized protein n=1 Tax=Eretmocerus hayati TaxID=131215 RepID=A0ACC2NAF9_9HYME|nr:hypothetical protein QAD02_009581 [Eretmocerus hayati]
MLPESKFPVTGGIMQTEEVVPRSQSTGLDASLSERSTPHLPGTTSIHFSQPEPQSQSVQFPTLISSLETVMTVKQEPQDEDEPSIQSITFSPKIEVEDLHPTPTGSPTSHKLPVANQPSPEAERSETQPPQQNGCKKPVSRARRKSRWKLKFHHQALPPEYLDHYEATLAHEAAMNNSTSSSSLTKSTTPRTLLETRTINTVTPTTVPVAFNSTPGATSPVTFDMRNWLQRLAAMQNEIYPNSMQMVPGNLCQTSPSTRRSVITSTQQSSPIQHHHQRAQQNQPRPPMKYSDLPYMGEITLDNSKPRRGRKPKKADICHLIYKNYGTILPGTPGLEDPSKTGLIPGTGRDGLGSPFQRSDIQNRISSLLERRLTQERRVGLDACGGIIKGQEEPMNLCVRDLDLLKIRLSEVSNGVLGLHFSPKSEGSSDHEDLTSQNLDLEQQSDLSNGHISHQVFHNVKIGGSDEESSLNNTNNGTSSQNHEGGVIDGNGCGIDLANNNNIQTNNNKCSTDSTTNQNSGLLYWPNAGVFIHPAALQSQLLYYQKLAQEKGQQSNSNPNKEHLVPKSIYSILESGSKSSSPTSPNESPAPSMQQTDTSPRLQVKRNSGSQVTSGSSQQPMKRKRSAIFIPPMPTDNNSNPTTEVSICKFKFTGGAKPSLQEKKSLSVDSGGNFRYYSGTGDKSMRGYEFFPRESLQQPSNSNSGPGICQPVSLLNAPIERISQMPNLTAPRLVQNQIPNMIPNQISNQVYQQDDRGRKRKSRKSVEREKLEQTFKEKGFLIQTQQLESAEGATYCKFRQLRKFTRYLFRSWKDYLPGNVRELDQSGEPLPPSPMPLKDLEQDGETISTPVSPMSPHSVDLAPNLVIDTSPPTPPTTSTAALSLPIIN